jgi:hypothetical protein
MTTLTEYERLQLSAIEAWKNDEPGRFRRALGVAIAPFAWLFERCIPETAVVGALDVASKLGRELVDTEDVLRKAQVPDVKALRGKSLNLCDGLADDVHNWALGVAVAQGSASGAFGIVSAPIDVPAIITIAMRTIHKIGVCYGYECNSAEESLFVRRILVTAGASTLEEKAAALGALTMIRFVFIRQTWAVTAKNIARRQLASGMVMIPAYELAKQIGISAVRAQVLSAIPIAGAMVGGAANGWYINEVGWAARRSFQERWLADNGKLTPEEAVIGSD